MKPRKTILIFCVLTILSISFPMGFTQTYDEIVYEQAKIGIFYYPWWYTTGNGSWDQTVVDLPVWGKYDSSNSTIIRKQLSMIEELGIDFVIISWWGTQDEFGRFTDKSAKEVFRVANSSQTSLKFAIMVEPFEIKDWKYDYEQIYSQIYNDFFSPYSSLYYFEDDRPLICFYNDPGYPPNLTYVYMPLDGRFTCRVVGEESYTDWTYLVLVRRVVRKNQVSVTPRYDDSRLADRAKVFQVDPKLEQGVYDYEWQEAIELWQQGLAETILISSWNEYYERTEIEPHFDATAVDGNPYFLYNKTLNNIAQLRQLELLQVENPTFPQNPTDSPNDSPDYSAVTSSGQTTAIPEYPTVPLFFFLLLFLTASVVVVKKRCTKGT